MKHSGCFVHESKLFSKTTQRKFKSFPTYWIFFKRRESCKNKLPISTSRYKKKKKSNNNWNATVRQCKKIIGKHQAFVSVKYLASDVADPKRNRNREHFERGLLLKRPSPCRFEESGIEDDYHWHTWHYWIWLKHAVLRNERLTLSSSISMSWVR